MKYYIIAGEASGDLHGSNLIKELLKLDEHSSFRCWGGDKMAESGATLVEHYRNTAFMGFAEVILNLRKIISFISKCKSDIETYQPDIVILIDYPGFNLRIAEWAKKKGFKVIYYITPQVWAWHKSRVHKLGKYTDKLLVILPFEPAFFKKYNYKAIFVGHPLLDAIEQFHPTHKIISNKKPLLALLPGSRQQEIKYILPIMLKACQHMDMEIALAGAPSINDAIYNEILNTIDTHKKVKLYRNQTYDLLSQADFAWVGSGTATLETALMGVPQIVCYKGHPLSYLIAKRLVNIPYISLVNLIAEEEVVKELIQDDLTVDNIVNETKLLQANKDLIDIKYKDLRQKLGNIGASAKAALEIIQTLHS